MNSNKKLLILGIDCLDYKLVKRWKLKAFMLTKHGTTYIGEDKYTPVVWAKFLTGKDVVNLGFSSSNLSRKKRLVSLYGILSMFENLHAKNVKKPVRTKSNFLVNRVKKSMLNILINNLREDKLRTVDRIIYKLLIRCSLVEKLPPKLKSMTFPYILAKMGLKTAVIEFPPLNDNIFSLFRNMMYFFIDSSDIIKRLFLAKTRLVTESLANVLLRLIRNMKYDLILWYTWHIDLASHVYYIRRDISRLTKLYAEYIYIARLVNKIILESSKLGYDILLISDHGFDPEMCDHSCYNYWSSTFNPSFIPRYITDFYEIVLNYFDR